MSVVNPLLRNIQANLEQRSTRVSQYGRVHRDSLLSLYLMNNYKDTKSKPGWHDKAVDHSYCFAEDISALTHAADQPGGLPGVSHSKNVQYSSSGGLPA